MLNNDSYDNVARQITTSYRAKKGFYENVEPRTENRLDRLGRFGRECDRGLG